MWADPGLFSDFFIAELFATLICNKMLMIISHFPAKLGMFFASGINSATGGSPGLVFTGALD